MYTDQTWRMLINLLAEELTKKCMPYYLTIIPESAVVGCSFVFLQLLPKQNSNDFLILKEWIILEGE